MYKIIKEKKYDLKNRWKNREIAGRLQLAENYITMIFNGTPCKYVTAYALVKDRDLNAKVEDYFKEV